MVICSLPCCANSGQYLQTGALVVDPAARMGDGQRHRRQALRGRVDQDHGVVHRLSLPVGLFRMPPHRSTIFSASEVGAARAP